MKLSHANPSRPRRAFTLVELMISIALALMLIYGISQVFKLSGDTVGANQAVGVIVRDYRAASATLTEDFRNSLFDSPMFLISNRIAYGYEGPGTGLKAGWRNAEEERDVDPAINPQKDPLIQEINGSVVTSSITAGTDRAPRIDRMGFFVRNLYRRQTASSAQVSSGTSSTDAYVWYGHTALPTSDPAVWAQPQNQYAADRVLGRVAIVMKNSNTVYKDKQEDPLLLPKPANANVLATTLWPLGWTTPETNENNLRNKGNSAAAYQSVKDLAPASIDEWRAFADAAYAVPNTGFNSWFRPMEDGVNLAQKQFWRAWCRPTVARPIDQVKMAQTAPYFVGHCTQFIVEYAGDYLNQAENDPAVPGFPTDVAVKMNPATGQMVYGTTDGVIDYVIDTSGDGTFDTSGKFTPNDPPTNPAKWVRRTRWYGLPRDVTGDGRITINDVVPLSDVLAYYEISMAAAGAAAGAPGSDKRAVAPWEIDLPNVPTPADDSFSKKQGLVDPKLKNTALPAHTGNPNASEKKYAQQDYGIIDRGASGVADPSISRAVAQGFWYTAAFHNEAPAMIRITMKIDDPSGKLRDGQWYQFILTR